jgi:hypothetical protein
LDVIEQPTYISSASPLRVLLFLMTSLFFKSVLLWFVETYVRNCTQRKHHEM